MLKSNKHLSSYSLELENVHKNDVLKTLPSLIIVQKQNRKADTSVRHLVSNGGQQSVEARGQKHASSEGVAQGQSSSVPVRLLTVNQQEAHWDQHASQHEAEQSQQAKQLGHQHLHPDVVQTL